MKAEKILIRFDGVCVLCSQTARFILKVDRKRKFVFQTLQDSGDPESFDTIVVVHNQESYRYFDAVLKIGNELGGIFRIVNLFRILPASWRKAMYGLIARNRYRWFGVRKTCYLPTDEQKERFV